MEAPEHPRPRGSAFGDVGLGCLAYISFQLLTAISVAVLGVAVLRSGGPATPATVQALSTVEKLGGVVMGFVGFGLAFSSSRGARLAGGSFARRARTVAASWGLLLVAGCAALAAPALLRRPPPPEPEFERQTVSVLSIDLVKGARGDWDDDSWEGAVASSSATGDLVQSVSWRHAAPLTEAGVTAMAAASMPLLQAAAGDMTLSVPPATPVQLAGARTTGYTWAVSGDETTSNTRVTTWDCPGTSLNVSLTTGSASGLGADSVARAHERSEQGALCLVDAATAAPRRNVQFHGSKKWVQQEVASGGSEQWATKDQLSQALLFTRRTSKLKQFFSTGVSCADVLATTAGDAISKQGATTAPGAAPRNQATATGCTSWIEAQVDVDGSPVPLSTFWELRDCRDGNHLFAGFFSFEPKKFPDPASLWTCGATTPSSDQ